MLGLGASKENSYLNQWIRTNMAALFAKKGQQLGAYFTQDAVYLVQTQGLTKPKFTVININKEQVNLNYLFIDEAKTIALLQEEFNKNGIKSADISIAINARDLVMRYFELPFMPSNEIEPAIMFESKRYLPFKAEEVYFDYQYFQNKKDKKLPVIFIGIKKEIIDQYLSVFKGLGCKINSIEPAHFSLLKLLDLEKTSTPTAIIDASSSGANISVVFDGFIYFSRDLNMPVIDQKTKDEAVSSANLLIKFINEIRVSLDYYRRQPSSMPVKNVIYLCESELKDWSDTLSKELDINIKAIKVGELKQLLQNNSMGFAKALAISISGGKSISSINLAAKKTFVVSRPTTSRKISVSAEALPNLVLNLFNNALIRNSFLVAILIVGLVYGYTFQRQLPYMNELKELDAKIPLIKIDMPYSSNDDLIKIKKKNIDKVNNFKSNLDSRKFVTPYVNNLVKIVPKGVWITDLNISKTGNNVFTFTISGKVYSKDEAKELQAINNFLNFIKQDPEFSKAFKSIETGSINSNEQIGEARVTGFNITCK